MSSLDTSHEEPDLQPMAVEVMTDDFMAQALFFDTAEAIAPVRSAEDDFDGALDDYIASFFQAQFDTGVVEKDPEFIEGEVKDWVNFARQSKIISGTDVIPFNPYKYQVELCRAHLSHPGTCVAKIRQCGITETFANIFLWKASRNEAYTAVVFSQGGDATAKIAERVKRMALSNPFCSIEKANTQEVALAGGGRILFRTSSPSGSRGLSSVWDILFDEWAFISPRGLDKTLWADVTPAQEMVGREAKIAVVSTPPTQEGTQYMEILRHGNGRKDINTVTRQMRDGRIGPIQWWADSQGWAKFFIHWKAHPKFAAKDDHLGEVKESKRIDEVRLQREYNLNFEVKDKISILDPSKMPRYTWPEAKPANPWLVFQSWDTAQSDSPGSAKWAGCTLALWNGNIYLINAFMRRMKFTQGVQEVRKLARTDSPHVILIENKSSGADVIDALEMENFQYPLRRVEPKRGARGTNDDPKIRRMAREAHQIEAGKLYLPEWAPWLSEVEVAMRGFPSPEHRDFVDCLSQGLAFARQHSEDEFFADEMDPVQPGDDASLCGFAEDFDYYR